MRRGAFGFQRHGGAAAETYRPVAYHRSRFWRTYQMREAGVQKEV